MLGFPMFALCSKHQLQIFNMCSSVSNIGIRVSLKLPGRIHISLTSPSWYYSIVCYTQTHTNKHLMRPGSLKETLIHMLLSFPMLYVRRINKHILNLPQQKSVAKLNEIWIRISLKLPGRIHILLSFATFFCCVIGKQYVKLHQNKTLEKSATYESDQGASQNLRFIFCWLLLHI